MPNEEREKLAALRRRRDAIRLAGDGMLDVLAAAEFLLAQPIPLDEDGARVRRVLETGMNVIYARPFTKSGLAQMKRARGLSPEQRAAHHEALHFRDTVFAHTDETPGREVLEIPDATEEWFLHWLHPTPKGLDTAIALAKAHLVSFLAELEHVNADIASYERRS
jgi:hypothetical protein